MIGYWTISSFSFPKERIESITLSNVVFATLYFTTLNQKSSSTISRINIHPVLVRVTVIILLIAALLLGATRAVGEHFAFRLIQARQLNDNDKAIRYSNKSLSWFYHLDNFGMPISWYKGSAYADQGKYKEALTAFDDAFSVTPYNIQVINNLASAHEVVGDHEKAKSLYLEAIRISPGFEDPKLNLAAIYYNESNYREALSWTQSVTNDSDRKLKYMELINAKIGTK